MCWIFPGFWRAPRRPRSWAIWDAEVIKRERPATGDDTRSWGPPYLQGDDVDAEISAYFLSANRNKQSLAIDLTHPEGQKLICKLVAESDVVIENFKVGGLKRYSLDYESLQRINPKLIYCSITGCTEPLRRCWGSSRLRS